MSRSMKTVAVLAATVVAALALSASALASFGGQSGSTTRWSVELGARTGSTVSPDSATELLPLTVVNDGLAVRVLNRISVSIATEPGGDAETTGGADIPGCRARWLRATIDAVAHPVLAPGSSYVGQVTLRMLDSGTDQDACKRAEPAVRLSAS